MIAFAQRGKKEEVLEAFSKVQGTEKKDAEFLPAIQAKVNENIAALTENVTSIALEVKARPTAADKLNLTTFVRAIPDE